MPGMKRLLVELGRLREPPRPCSYLPAEIAALDYRLIAAIADRPYEELLARGWRRFGIEFFRPACSNCAKCRSLRVRVQQFTPSQSQRRNLRRNAHLQVVVQPPTITAEHLRVVNAYQGDMHTRRGWPLQRISEAAYREIYLMNPGAFAREFLYFDGAALVGIGLADILPNALSSISFFHDPALRDRALGVYSVLYQLQFARERGIPYQYLGYWISECQSMAYKAQYRPHEVLERYVTDSEEPRWTLAL